MNKTKKISALAVLVGSLAIPPVAQAAKVDVIASEFHAYPTDASGCLYGFGWEDVTYRAIVTADDIAFSGKFRDNGIIIRKIANELYEKICGSRCGSFITVGMRVDEIAAQLSGQNPQYDPSKQNHLRLEKGDALRYKTRLGMGTGMRCLF